MREWGAGGAAIVAPGDAGRDEDVRASWRVRVAGKGGKGSPKAHLGGTNVNGTDSFGWVFFFKVARRRSSRRDVLSRRRSGMGLLPIASRGKLPDIMQQPVSWVTSGLGVQK